MLLLLLLLRHLLLLLSRLSGNLRLLGLLVNGVDGSLGLRSVPIRNGLGGSLGGHITTASSVVARVGRVHHGLHGARFLLDGRLIRQAWLILDSDAIAVGLAARHRQRLSGRLWTQSRLSVAGLLLLLLLLVLLSSSSSRLCINSSLGVLLGLCRRWCFGLGIPGKLSNVELGQLVLPSLSRHVSYILSTDDYKVRFSCFM